MLRHHLRRHAHSAFKRQLHVNTQTLAAPSARQVTEYLDSCRLTPETAILYLLHPELDDISSIVSTLQKLPHPSIGSIALAAPTQSPTTATVSIATFTPTSSTERITLFRSDLVGRPDAQVGKWQRDSFLRETMTGTNGAKNKRPEDRKGEDVGEMERVMLGLGVSGGSGTAAGAGIDHRVMGWNALWRSGRDVSEHHGDSLPEELTDVSEISSMILLADGTPDALLRMLNQRYSAVQKLGLVTYPTPFLTNRPFTFFHNETVYDHGAVGIAFSGIQGSISGGVEYPGLEPLGPVEEIAQAQGNLLLRLAPSSSSTTTTTGTISNPTQALIKAINTFRATLKGESLEAQRPAEAMTAAQGISIGKGMKEEEYYLALYSGESETPYQVVKIMSGDPSRGAISLEMEEPLLTGQRVQFMHKPRATAPSSFTPRHDEVSFHTVPQEEYTSPSHAIRAHAQASQPGFAVGSEGGFFFSGTGARRSDRIATGVCKVTNARGYLRFHTAG
ncbi:hypothetical protein NCC49_000191 [Naganishia albida]|nr:hypothetical protein NCC49_000191 [Naganishia albida]